MLCLSISHASRVLLLATALPILLLACKPSEKAEDAANKPQVSLQAVSLAQASERELTRALVVSGPVSAVEEMQLGVELSGLRVTALHVDAGQAVKRGQLLLTLDHRMLDAELAQADAALREAEAAAGLARSHFARGENLANSQYISAMQLDELRAARTQGEARLGTARAARNTAALRRSFAELRAPADGIISKRLVQPGQVVMAGAELLRLIKNGRLEWRAELPAGQLGQVNVGDVIHLSAPDGSALQGRVRAVSPGVDAATRTGTVYADLPSGLLQSRTLQAGTYLEGRIDSGIQKVLAVPADAVLLRDGFPVVFVLDDKAQARLQRIETGERVDGFVEVKSGLAAGTQVVLEGAGFLTDGDKVRVLPASADAAPNQKPAP
ncbi:efflux transporter periplasmic adaptor subunit [Lysobacteraceae bacterium NML75-0749]|nr:efflux transporter periplasmic adaptor subunit [Xanthomonadaceae bacterium NML75-0749]PJK03679.1 efflux transporter periplasmic adaptor subunit [Xanthomonadaceae bacterium NML91-0268]